MKKAYITFWNHTFSFEIMIDSQAVVRNDIEKFHVPLIWFP
jgi:hypothetical protein